MLPEDFLQRMEGQLGEEYPAFLASYEHPRYQALRLNTLKKTESGETMEKVLTALFHMEKVPWAKNGYYYDPQTQPGRHPFHEAGLYYIQEPSAMAPVGFLDIKPGERVLDLCAAPGGKSTQIGALLAGKGLLVCNEINPARAKILSENVERMGLVNACVTNESPDRLAAVFPEFFDKILVDAPCSGEGMFRKNEVAATEWSPENVQLCGERQDGILEQAARMLRPGGRLVYSTCTFAEWENEGTIGRFLDKQRDFQLVRGLSFPLKEGEDSMPGEESQENRVRFDGMLRLYPHRLKGEGHFLAVLQKAGNMGEGYECPPPMGVAKEIREKDCREWQEFQRDTLRCSVREIIHGRADGGFLLKFGDHLYLVPEGFPEIKGMKVLRPGLHLGELKKNRFEPSHALALALGAKDVRHVWRLCGEDPNVLGYLNGQTFPAEGDKGWYLICTDGISLGWGKLAGGMMKNHYPRGLRLN